MFEYNHEAAVMEAVATGHAETMQRWEDGPNGRRPSGQAEIDEATGAPVRVYDVLLPTGREGRHELHPARVISHEAPEFTPYQPVELVNVRVTVRPAPKGGKGIVAYFSAEGIRPATGASASFSSRSANKKDEEAA